MKTIMLLMMMADPGTSAKSPPDVQLLDFTAGYCQPCQQMVPILQRMEHDKFPVRQIDITEEYELARQFRIDLVPTLVLLVEGKEVKRFVGLTDEAELRSEMNKAARKLAESRNEKNRSQVAQQESPRDSMTAESQPQPAAPRRSSVKDIFRGLLSSNTPATAFEYPTLRGQSPDAASETLTGIEAAAAATVRVRVAGTSTKNGSKVQDVGTGTIVYSETGQAIILTVAHVFLDIATDNADIEVEVFENGKAVPYRASLIGGDHNSDLAFLKIQTSRIMPSVRLTEKAPTVTKGQALISFGCNKGNDPTRLETKVVDTDRYDGPSNLVCTTDPQSGRSGGGLFNGNGELTGVCSCADRERHEGLYMAHAPVMKLVQSLKLQSILMAPPASIGEDAASTFAAMQEANRDPQPRNPPRPETRSASIAEVEPPSFDESVGLFDEQHERTEIALADGDTLTDAPRFGPKKTETAAAGQSVPANIKNAEPAEPTGPEVTIVIDDKTPGSQKRVIVIPQATPWMIEMLTGESIETTQSSVTALRPAATSPSRTIQRSGRTANSQPLRQAP